MNQNISMTTENAPLDPYESIRYIKQSYDVTNSDESALNLILTLRPEWRESRSTIELERFTDGITNTVRLHTWVEIGL
jgi:ethanolamine kinase